MHISFFAALVTTLFPVNNLALFARTGRSDDEKRDVMRKDEIKEITHGALRVFPRDLHFCAERKSPRRVFVAGQRLVRQSFSR